MIKAIIFDCFGVLVSEGWIAYRDRYFPEGEKRQAAMELRQAADRGLITNEEFEQHVADLAGVSLQIAQSYLHRNAPNEPLFVYIKQELKPRFRLGMLSNAAADWLSMLFNPEQLKLFDQAVLSYQIGHAKPEPEAFETICQRLGAKPEECIFVDDAEHFCAAARTLGMQAIWYQDFAQTKTEIEKILAT